MPDIDQHAVHTALENPQLDEITTAEWDRQDEGVDAALRDTFPASDPSSATPVIGVGGCNRNRQG